MVKKVKNRIEPTQYLELSSRLQSVGKGSSKGASCNVFVVEDSIDSLTEAQRWATLISKSEGAPTLIMDQIRPAGSPVSDGSTASGVCSFVLAFDGWAHAMKRAEKKNGVLSVYIDANHPDLDQWLNYPNFVGKLDCAYTGVLLYPGIQYSDEVLAKIALAYHEWRLAYICKPTKDDRTGEWLYPNVCTEIRIRHKGQCALGAIKLHDMAGLTRDQFAGVVGGCVARMSDTLEVTQYNAYTDPDLYSFEPQVGLGWVGMANFIGKLGSTYQEVVSLFDTMFPDGIQHLTMPEIMGIVESFDPLQFFGREVPGYVFWDHFIYAVHVGDLVASELSLNRVWTAQPTAHTSRRVNDQGYAVAPELQPPLAVRGEDRLSRHIQQSELKGSYEAIYPSYVQTRDEVPYHVYRRFAEHLQSLFQVNGRSHTFSHNVYAEVVDLQFVKDFIKSPLGSLYYRLSPSEAQVQSKAQTWDGVDITDLFADDPNPEPPLDSDQCPIDPTLREQCESCSM
jgi:Ribonucleotide reductase, barrel domain